MCSFNMNRFTITAHTGAMNTKHNSLESIDAAVSCKADIAEIDVSFRKDGTPVIIHNSTPCDNEGVLLKDALKQAAKSDNLRLNLDLKAFWNTGAVQNALIEHNLLKRAFFTGVFTGNVHEVKNGSPLIPYYINVSIDKQKRKNEQYLSSLAKEILSLGAIGLNSHYKNINKDTVKAMHSHNLLVSAWTVNGYFSQRKLLALGVDNITTLRPERLRKLSQSLHKYR